ncbi:pilus (MSHA type) biogenesis protein MshL [Rhodoferax sp. TS-BS-61-7]|uniref:pilus (MSHA type) biogenesis protein MshL n=1 Tax=Rhodoferax sp. TS-BS-61-7 TaxID=2094194 RepID=UPI0011B09569|nr:pilus (MSHA type) biogenesis protein MshL [Rhodoferax sp. TS-BS-61-7]
MKSRPMNEFDTSTLTPVLRPPLALWSLLGVSLLSGCAALDRPLRTPDVSAAVRAELPAPMPTTVVPAKVSDALAEPAAPPVALPPEPRLDLLVNNAQAREVFLAIVADTRYSMLMHPDVSGTLSVTLRGVTVTEALEAIRDVYGYDFKVDGRRITVYAPTLQTRIFTINYPTSLRSGSSELRVSSGAALQSSATGTTASSSNAGTAAQQPENSRVSTTSRSDFWGELAASVRSLVGTGEGRNVVSSPQAGILAVRAMPEELRQVDKFLKATQASVERQVMLEAKVVEVELRDGYQSGVNWGAMGSDVNGQAAVGVIGSGVSSTNAFVQGTTTINGAVAFPAVASGGGLFGLALATSQFGAVLGFLETQGDVQTLSSPRLATMNNQKAVLKVGSDDFYVTAVTSGSTSSSGSSSSGTTTTMPTVTLTPFFSGISLDVTPQIDDGVNVTLHVHPSLTTVTEKTKQVDLGSVGNYRLPLASSAVNETDTLVRIQDGNIVAIGGLMQLESSRNASGIPGTTGMPGLGALFGNRATQGRKKEVIVLIKPTIIRTAADWDAQGRRARAALDDMDATRARVIQIDGNQAK